MRPHRLAALLACATLAAAHARSAPPGERASSTEAALPALDHEPLLRVLLARAPRVAVHLEAPVRLDASGSSTRLAPGTWHFAAAEGGWRVEGVEGTHAGLGSLAGGGRPVFALDALPAFGEPRRLRLAGDLVVRADGGAVEVIERVPMETYLASVVAAEMNPAWPESALAAQAIAARSYAAARWMERHDRPWHLHWHFGVDMAYHGWSDGNRAVARAIAPTRGEVLVYRDLPVLALFHASSGGRTEAFERVKPGALAPDGTTPIAAAMPVVEDPAALAGAQGLNLVESHGRWRTAFPLDEVTEALRAWGASAQPPLAFGTVEAVSVLERHTDSDRVARVSVRHRLDGAARFTALAATDFRLALGPGRVRSTWWERCTILQGAPPTLVLAGRGYGHGCGLSQVSAWFLATRGATAEEIVERFYAGATIERRY